MMSLTVIISEEEEYGMVEKAVMSWTHAKGYAV
jgi:hypothetical protein